MPVESDLTRSLKVWAVSVCVRTGNSSWLDKNGGAQRAGRPRAAPALFSVALHTCWFSHLIYCRHKALNEMIFWFWIGSNTASCRSSDRSDFYIWINLNYDSLELKFLFYKFPFYLKFQFLFSSTIRLEERRSIWNNGLIWYTNFKHWVAEVT